MHMVFHHRPASGDPVNSQVVHICKVEGQITYRFPWFYN